MPQPHGLGRGLSSLIPQNQKKSEVSTGDSPQPVSSAATAQKASPFGVKMAPLQKLPPVPSETREKSVKSADQTIASGASSGVSQKQQGLSSPVFDIPAVQVENPSSPTEMSSSSVENPPVSTGEGVALSVPIGNVIPNPHQPRIQFSEEKLMELAQSIKEHGILQPLIVTRSGGNFELIAGERRLQAARIVGLSEVPVIVREAENQEKFELAIIENIQRHDLNPIEEARAYDRLSKEFQLSQESIAKKMGRSRSAIANTMRLLQLPVDIQRAVADDKISEGHAKALLAIDNAEKQRALFEMIVQQSLTVREAEAKSRGVSTRPPKRVSKDPEIEGRENTLSEIFGTKVRIAKTASGGTIRIEYFSDEEFKNIFSKLSGKHEDGTGSM
ncbi:MAG: ParB/RepB/Spo0J family partition protein [Candidatus Moraniibacteriota bacterium]|nr:MAG: ParB/RepB/Spo0J family partition protein [Candidatus Moranbacteria bacterium]